MYEADRIYLCVFYAHHTIMHPSFIVDDPIVSEDTFNTVNGLAFALMKFACNLDHDSINIIVFDRF